ncbi:hypothetical protein VTO58DRAFT_110992 [Aureobasidium pullulans]
MELQDLPLKSEAADTKSLTEYTNSRLHETSTRIHPVQSPRSGTTKQTAAENIISMDHGEAQEKEQPRMPASKNRPARYMILLVLLYDTLAIFAWVIPCILTKRPVTTTNGYNVNFDGPRTYRWLTHSVVRSVYTKNEDCLQAAQVIRSIAAVLTIPLTSAVCSRAAVAFVQQYTRSDLTLRKTLALADRGWTDPLLYYKMLAGDFKKCGTRFLVGASLLKILGGILVPLQTCFLTTTSIRTPTFPDDIRSLADIVDLLDLTSYSEPKSLTTVLARSAITSTDLKTPQSMLWTENSVNCIQRSKEPWKMPLPMSCVRGLGNKMSNMTELPNPFLAQLPFGYSSGLIRQFLLRINSTAHR